MGIWRISLPISQKYFITLEDMKIVLNSHVEARGSKAYPAVL